MKQEKTFSTRARDLINRPQHMINESQKNYHVMFDSSDNILTVKFSSRPKIKNIHHNILFNEVLCRLSVGKKLEKIASFTFREIENFLRDENHLPAFDLPVEEIKELEISFINAKFAFLAACFLSNLSTDEAKSSANLSTKTGFLGSLAEKNAAFDSFIALVNKRFQGKNEVEFVMFEAPVLYLKWPVETWSPLELNLFITCLLFELDVAEEIKVVAVQ